MRRIRKISTAAVTCVLASTAVLGATQAHASPWDCDVTGSLDQSGGPTNPIPWLNGTDGKLPELQGRTSAVEYITGALSPNQTVERFNVLGTDLGILWDNGAGQVLTASATPSESDLTPCVPGWSVTGAATSCSVARTEICPTA